MTLKEKSLVAAVSILNLYNIVPVVMGNLIEVGTFLYTL